MVERYNQEVGKKKNHYHHAMFDEFLVNDFALNILTQ
jgi:hypothetical protein